MGLGQARGDDADHADMPALPREHERAPPSAVAERRDLRFGLEPDPALDLAALVVDAIELLRDLRRARRILGQDQLERGVGAVQPPRGVQPRGQSERDRALVHPRRVDRARPPSARAAPAWPSPPARAARAARARGSRRAAARRRRSSRAPPGRGRAPAGARAQKRPRQLVATAVAHSSGTRIPAHRRVHDRRVRQRARPRARVMVADDHLHAQLPRQPRPPRTAAIPQSAVISSLVPRAASRAHGVQFSP